MSKFSVESWETLRNLSAQQYKISVSLDMFKSMNWSEMFPINCNRQFIIKDSKDAEFEISRIRAELLESSECGNITDLTLHAAMNSILDIRGVPIQTLTLSNCESGFKLLSDRIDKIQITASSAETFAHPIAGRQVRLQLKFSATPLVIDGSNFSDVESLSITAGDVDCFVDLDSLPLLTELIMMTSAKITISSTWKRNFPHLQVRGRSIDIASTVTADKISCYASHLSTVAPRLSRASSVELSVKVRTSSEALEVPYLKALSSRVIISVPSPIDIWKMDDLESLEIMANRLCTTRCVVKSILIEKFLRFRCKELLLLVLHRWKSIHIDDSVIAPLLRRAQPYESSKLQQQLEFLLQFEQEHRIYVDWRRVIDQLGSNGDEKRIELLRKSHPEVFA